MRVDVHWQGVGDDGEAWDWTCGLYAYQHPRARELLYIGKADGTSIRGRWRAADKDGLWRDLERDRRIYQHRVLVGAFALAPEMRLTRQLVADVESMLIFAVQPWGNIASCRSRICRPGLRVRNFGRVWPGPRDLKDARHYVEYW
jgi:hypothetical protein